MAQASAPEQLPQVVVVVTWVLPPPQLYTVVVTVQLEKNSASRGASNLLPDTSCRPAAVTGVSPVLAKAVVAEATATSSISTFFMGKRVVESALRTVRWLTGWSLLCGFMAVFGDDSARTGNEATHPPRFKPGPAKATEFLLLSS